MFSGRGLKRTLSEVGGSFWKPHDSWRDQASWRAAPASCYNSTWWGFILFHSLWEGEEKKTTQLVYKPCVPRMRRDYSTHGLFPGNLRSISRVGMWTMVTLPLWRELWVSMGGEEAWKQRPLSPRMCSVHQTCPWTWHTHSKANHCSDINSQSPLKSQMADQALRSKEPEGLLILPRKGGEKLPFGACFPFQVSWHNSFPHVFFSNKVLLNFPPRSL